MTRSTTKTNAKFQRQEIASFSRWSNSIEITEEIKNRLKTYNLSRCVLKASKLKKGWQKKIPDAAILIIIEQVQNIISEEC